MLYLTSKLFAKQALFKSVGLLTLVVSTTVSNEWTIRYLGVGSTGNT